MHSCAIELIVETAPRDMMLVFLHAAIVGLAPRYNGTFQPFESH
jgi:hypothetical protein